jgi:tRNA A37 methylthiotransferase MiaB
MRFAHLFYGILKKQLVLKGICTEEDWETWKNDITVDFVKDNHFTELRDIEVLRERVQTLDMVQNYVGEYYSKEWVQKNVLMLSDEDIENMKKEIDGETEEEPEEEPQEVPQQEEPPTDGGQKHSIDINVKGNN